MKGQIHLRGPWRAQIAKWGRYREFMLCNIISFNESELMVIWNSLRHNQIGDEGVTSLASALQTPSSKVTFIEWVMYWTLSHAWEWTDPALKQSPCESIWRTRREGTCECTEESKLQGECDIVSLWLLRHIIHELMVMWNSLTENQIGEQGARALASALQSPTCKVEKIVWVIQWKYRPPREGTDLT